MDVRVFPLGPLETNSFLCVEGKKAVVVDAGGDPGQVMRAIEAEGLTLERILLTHMHCDHIYGVRELCEATKTPVVAGAGEAAILETDICRGGFMGLPMVPEFPFSPVGAGETRLLDQPCLILETPGHTPGSLSFSFPESKVVFTGDLLFARSIGRSDFPGGDHDTLIRSVREKIFTLPDDTVVYPGHGPRTTVGAEKRHNPFFSEFAS